MRLISLSLLALLLCACAEGSGKYAKTSAGFLEPAARNRLSAGNPDAVTQTADGFARGGNLTAAKNLYEQVLAHHPDHAGARRGLGVIALRSGDTIGGLSALEAVWRDNPDDITIRKTYVDSLVQAGKLDDARTVLRLARQDGVILVSERVQLGALEEVLGDAARARREWDMVQDLAPDSAEGRLFLALSFALDKNYETAVALVQPALETPETRREATSMLGNIYALSGQWETAISIMQTVFSGEEAEARRALYQVLPTLRRSEQARALLLGQITQSALDALK